MYSKPDYTTFTVDGWKSLLVFTSEKLPASITPEMKTMMTAKKPFRKINATKIQFYCIYQPGK
jgi:hypothetical protein